MMEFLFRVLLTVLCALLFAQTQVNGRTILLSLSDDPILSWKDSCYAVAKWKKKDSGQDLSSGVSSDSSSNSSYLDLRRVTAEAFVFDGTYEARCDLVAYTHMGPAFDVYVVNATMTIRQDDSRKQAIVDVFINADRSVQFSDFSCPGLPGGDDKNLNYYTGPDDYRDRRLSVVISELKQNLTSPPLCCDFNVSVNESETAEMSLVYGNSTKSGKCHHEMSTLSTVPEPFSHTPAPRRGTLSSISTTNASPVSFLLLCFLAWSCSVCF